jgi:glycosyltransferase involved in cell wall biosynthesis
MNGFEGDGPALVARGAGASLSAGATRAASPSNPAKTARVSAKPLVSVLMFVRDGMPHVERAIRSVLAQDYDHLEFVIQDGGSTDGTVEFISGLNEPRIKLVSRPDAGPADAFAKAVARCKGDILASCLYDEELMPGALARVVEIFAEHPYLGAVTGDAHISDIWGDVYAKFTGAPFNMLKYLNGEYCPYWCSSFFNTNAMRFVGLFDDRWSKASLEFEVWVRLAMETDILYVPEIFSKYAHHAKQLSQAGGRAGEEIEARIEIIRTRLFGHGKYFGENYYQRDVFCLLQLINLHRHLSDWDAKAADAVLKRIVDADYLGEFNAARGGGADPAFAIISTPQVDSSQFAISQAALVVAPPVPSHEFIIQNRSVGSIYRRLTPRFIRAMVPYDLKVRLAMILGLRKRNG